MAVLKYYNTATSAWEYIAASTTANFTTWKKTMAGGETSVSGTDDNGVTLSYTVGLEQVFINGALQVRGSDYTATTGTSITGLSALFVNDIVSVVCYAPFNVANTIAPTVVDAKGDLIAGTAADTVGRLAVGTNNQQLVADSTAATGLKWDLPSALVLVKSQTIGTTVSSVNVTSAFNSTYDNYLILVSNGTASAPATIRLTLGATATGYYYAGYYVPYSGASSNSTGSNTTSFLAGAHSTGITAYSIYIGQPNLAQNTVYKADYFSPNTTDGTISLLGFLNNTTQYTDFTLTPSTGTFTGGEICVYGFRK